VSCATPSPAPPKRYAEASWVQPGTGNCKIHPSAGRTRDVLLVRIIPIIYNYPGLIALFYFVTLFLCNFVTFLFYE
jgi:hypothetical protein